MAISLVWFRNDLRLADNPALAAGLESGSIVPIFVLDPAAKWGGASLWWLHHSLASLARDCAARGAKLVLRRGDSAAIIAELAATLGAEAVHAGRAHEPWLRHVDRAAAEELAKRDIAFHRHRSALMFGGEQIVNKTGGVYGVYTPFSRACFEAFSARPAIAPPQRIESIADVASDALDDWQLLPTRPDWSGGLAETWQPGEAGAHERLSAFLDADLDEYDRQRNLPGRSGTSMLSPHLHWGEIAIDAVWRATEAARTTRAEGRTTFLKELVWREFAAYLLWHNQDLDTVPMKAQFAAMPWRDAPGELHAWQRGRTGIPIVDAGMRQLWQTGWMHNRLRMITASFLVKHLLIPWQTGEAWFWDCLVDADAASNAASWQWVAGCGADAAPYFRIFNPVLQGLKFDPDGAYVRRFVPELANLPDEVIHAPWDAPQHVLRGAGVILGRTYPEPIVDLASGRDRALAALKEIGNSPS
jgi:deoxyribodipyrimidine photo-lyase type I